MSLCRDVRRGSPYAAEAPASPVTVARGSAADRILRLLAERWPVTTEDIARALRLRPDVVRREVQKLAAQGKVTVEPLGERTYVALRGKVARPEGPPRDDPAFG